MARRATAIKQERAKGEGLLLVLDAGGSLTGRPVSIRSQGRNIVEAMNAMGYDALALGRSELDMGLDALRERAAEASFAFLSANLVSSESGELLFEPYVVFESGGARVGVIGLSEPAAAQAARVAGQAEVLDPSETAQRYVLALRPDVDILIVLSHLGLEADAELARGVPGIDIIVGGSSRRLLREPERVGNTLIVQQGYLGEWMGRLEATFDEFGEPVQYAEQVITLGPDFADDAEVAEIVDRWNALYPTPTRFPTPVPPTPTPSSYPD